MKPLYRIFALIFPERCPYCSDLIEPEKIACDKCLNEIKRKHTPLFSGVGGYRCVSSFAYGGKVRRMIIRLKFHDRTQYIPQISEILASDITAAYQISDIDFLTYVPMHKTDQAERGYNQSQLLSEELSRKLSIPCIETLKKVKRTKKQHKLKYFERKNNLAGAFSVIDKDTVKGKNILMIDDVVTSGQTLSKCCKILNTAKPRSIICATIASAKGDYPENSYI